MKGGIATGYGDDGGVNMLVSLSSGELLQTRVLVKSGLLIEGGVGGKRRRRKADYRGINVITYKRID